MEVIRAGKYAIRDLAEVYAGAGFEVEWYGGEDLPASQRERYLRDAHVGRDWVGEDDEPIFCLMLASPRPGRTACFAHPQCGWMHLRLYFTEGLRPDAPRAAVYKYVNRVNRRFKLLRAYFDGYDAVVFEYWLLLTFGVGRQALVESTDFFASVGQRAVDELDRDRVLAFNWPRGAGPG
jgi:hypothetical protein